MHFEPRQRTRLRGFDYSLPGAYFFTICTHRFQPILGKIEDAEVRLSPGGQAVLATWAGLPRHYPYVELDEFVVMPNHVHGVLVLTASQAAGGKRRGLPVIIGSLKSYSSRLINRRRGGGSPPVWQRGFYEHVIRPEEDLHDYRRYIAENPLKWDLDRLNRQPGNV